MLCHAIVYHLQYCFNSFIFNYLQLQESKSTAMGEGIKRWRLALNTANDRGCMQRLHKRLYFVRTTIHRKIVTMLTWEGMFTQGYFSVS